MLYVDSFVNNIVTAAIAKDSVLLREHIQNGLNIHTANKNGLNAGSLLPAVCNDFDTCLFLIDHGAQPFDLIGGAIRANNKALLKTLFAYFDYELKQLITEQSEQRERLFNYFAACAAYAGDLPMVVAFFDKLPNNKRHYTSAAGAAAWAGQFDITNQLIVLSNNSYANHVAMQACRGGNSDYASLLLGSLPASECNFFMMATGCIKGGHLEDALYAASKVRDPYCNLNLALESASAGQIEIMVAFLRDHELNKEIAMRLMSAAIMNGHLDVVKFLSNQDNAIEIDFRVLIDLARKCGHQGIVNFCADKLDASTSNLMNFLVASSSLKRKRDEIEPSSSNAPVDEKKKIEPRMKKPRRDPLESTLVGAEMKIIYDFNRKTKTDAKNKIGTIYQNKLPNPRAKK